MTPKISVVIPTYNCGALIPEALDSIFAQTFTDFEVIVVDDGSTDNTRDVVSRYREDIRYIYQNNKGVSAARNAGIKEARGQYIALLDADDLWLPEKLASQMRVMTQSDAIGIVACGLFCIDDKNNSVKTVIPENYSDKDNLIRGLYFDPAIFFGAGSSILVRKACFEKVGLFDEGLHAAEDWDMCLRIIRSYDVRSLPLPLLKYRARAGSCVSGKNVEQTLMYELQFINKVFRSDDLKWRLFLRAKAFSRRYLRAVGACEAVGQPEGVKKFLLKGILTFPPILLEKRVLARFSSLVLGKTRYEKLMSGVRACLRFINE